MSVPPASALPPDAMTSDHANARRFNPLIAEENHLTMANAAAVLAYLARTFQIHYEAHLCPDFDLPPLSSEELCGLMLICRTLETALLCDAPPVVLAGNLMVKV